MNILDFHKWVRLRDARPPKQMPECDRILQVVAAAGNRGISRGDLGQEIKLDRNTLTDLVAAYLRLGQITVTQENGDEVIRSTAFSVR